MRIAICDDEKSMGQILEEKVKKLLPDAVVEKYLLGDDLISSGFKPDILFMDIQMPVMNGYEATANIRAGESDYWKNIPVIAMTANVFQEDESRAAECGMSDYVTKPIDMNVIYSVLEKWLRGQKG